MWCCECKKRLTTNDYIGGMCKSGQPMCINCTYLAYEKCAKEDRKKASKKRKREKDQKNESEGDEKLGARPKPRSLFRNRITKNEK